MYGRRMRRCLQYLVPASILICCFLLWGKSNPPELPSVLNNNEKNCRSLPKRMVYNLSTLGRRLFLEEYKTLQPRTQNFTILVWKFGPYLERRHIHHFGNNTYDPFEDCSVSNCVLTYRDEDVETADAVLFHLHQTKGPDTLPQGPRLSTQRWVFLTDESPYNTFLNGGKNTLSRYNGLFNWSMTYRMESDVPVPYGRTVPLSQDEKQEMAAQTNVTLMAEKTGLVAIMLSHCSSPNKRMEYVKELQKYIPVDVYGGCGTLKCPGHFTSDCPLLNKYKFYLAFENTNCRGYVTEKVWWNALAKDALPVVMGPPREEYETLLPPASFLHVDDAASPEQLAQLLLKINASDELYSQYFQWKKSFKVLNEHGYFQTPVFHYCRLCEALNYNDRQPKVYDHLEEFWSVKRDCQHKNWMELRSSTSVR